MENLFKDLVFTIPAGDDWSAEEKATLQKFNSHISTQLNKYFQNGAIAEDVLKAKIENTLKDSGFDAKKIEDVRTAIKAMEDDVKKHLVKIEETKEALTDRIVKNITDKTGATTVSEFVSWAGKNQSEANIVIKDAIMTTDMDGLIGTTNMDRTVGWQYARRLSFLPYLRKVTEATDKGRFGYTEGSYTSNAGYAAEGNNQVADDIATAVERTRAYAKISAIQRVTTETGEDLPQFARGLVDKLEYGAFLFADQQVYNGDGSDATNPNHIYGILPVASAFDTTTYASTVSMANIADLFSAMENQINNKDKSPFIANIAWMNNTDLFRMQRLKDTTGQPIVNRDLFNNPTVGNIRIITSALIPANSMIMADSQCIELRIKRNFMLNFDYDKTNDVHKVILFARLQILVQERDKVGIISVPDIEAAIDSLNIVEPAP